MIPLAKKCFPFWEGAHNYTFGCLTGGAEQGMRHARQRQQALGQKVVPLRSQITKCVPSSWTTKTWNKFGCFQSCGHRTFRGTDKATALTGRGGGGYQPAHSVSPPPRQTVHGGTKVQQAPVQAPHHRTCLPPPPCSCALPAPPCHRLWQDHRGHDASCIARHAPEPLPYTPQSEGVAPRAHRVRTEATIGSQTTVHHPEMHPPKQPMGPQKIWTSRPPVLPLSDEGVSRRGRPNPAWSLSTSSGCKPPHAWCKEALALSADVGRGRRGGGERCFRQGGDTLSHLLAARLGLWVWVSPVLARLCALLAPMGCSSSVCARYPQWGGAGPLSGAVAFSKLVYWTRLFRLHGKGLMEESGGMSHMPLVPYQPVPQVLF